MSGDVPINPARRSKSFTSSDLAVAAGIKTSFATVASPVTLTTADWNGSVVAAAGRLTPARTITIARSNAASQYTTAPIVITGKRDNQTVTESLTPGNVNGNDVLRGTQSFDYVTQIDIPAQGGTGGAFTIGVQDICAPHANRFVGVRVHATGTLNVQYGSDNGSPQDAIPIVQAGQLEPIAPTRILTNPTLASPTTVALTVYFA